MSDSSQNHKFVVVSEYTSFYFPTERAQSFVFEGKSLSDVATVTTWLWDQFDMSYVILLYTYICCIHYLINKIYFIKYTYLV